MIKVYVAGPLFTEAEMTQRKHEGKQIREVLNGLDHVVFNPIESPVNFKDMKPTSSAIFSVDYDFMFNATHFFFDLSNADQGTFAELGMALEMYRNNREAAAIGLVNPIQIYPVFSDIRIPHAGEYNGMNVPVGNNQFVVGALEYYDIPIYSTFSDALDQFALDVSKAR